MQKILAMLMTAVFLSGCSTVQSKYGMGPEEPHQWGHIYSGVTENIGTWCMLSLPETSYFVKTITFVSIVIDFPFSIVADTVLIPVDLLVEPKYPKLTADQLCEIHKSRVNIKSNRTLKRDAS
jgi:uncharacterized protein YceK